MIMVKPSVQEIVESDILKKIEYISRTCYKSEDLITEDSAVRFVKQLIDSKHYAMLEHAVFTYCLPIDLLYCDIEDCRMPSRWYRISILTAEEAGPDQEMRLIVSANLRTLIEGEGNIHAAMRTILAANHPEVDALIEGDYDYQLELPGYEITDVSLLPERIRDLHSFKSFKFVTDRGVSHEFVRMRDSSFAQSSTRYCNYSKAKFGREITYCEPANLDQWTNDQKLILKDSLQSAEDSYMLGIDAGLVAQQARAMLDNATMTELVVTADEKEWHHIGDLRYRGTTGAPHPDMKALMDELVKVYPSL